MPRDSTKPRYSTMPRYSTEPRYSTKPRYSTAEILHLLCDHHFFPKAPVGRVRPKAVRSHPGVLSEATPQCRATPQGRKI